MTEAATQRYSVLSFFFFLFVFLKVSIFQLQHRQLRSTGMFITVPGHCVLWQGMEFSSTVFA